MKIVNSIAFTLLLIMFSTSLLSAQPGERGRRGERGGTIEERVAKQTQRMVEDLDLSTAQGTKIKAVNLKFAEKIAVIRKEVRESGDRESMREVMPAIREQHDAEIRKYLTAEQSEKWNTLQVERAEKRGKWREKRKKAGKGS